MKKAIRFALLILAAAIIATSLCGCDVLDNARENHGTWTEEGNILLNGVEYKPLPYDENFYFPSFSQQTIMVTEPDVPVLLIGFFGQEMQMSSDKVLLLCYHEKSNTYCRADKYDEFAAKMNTDFVPDGYYYEYFPVDEDGFMSDFPNYYRLTDEQATAINQVLAQADPMELPVETTDTYSYCAELMAATEDLYFRDYFADLMLWENGYYLVTYPEEENYVLYYRVPTKQEEIFRSILNTLIAAEDAFYAGMEEM